MRTYMCFCVLIELNGRLAISLKVHEHVAGFQSSVQARKLHDSKPWYGLYKQRIWTMNEAKIVSFSFYKLNAFYRSVYTYMHNNIRLDDDYIHPNDNDAHLDDIMYSVIRMCVSFAAE